MEFSNIWKLELENTKPAKVPLILKLKSDAMPKRAKSIRYPLEHIRFVKLFVSDLENTGCIKGIQKLYGVLQFMLFVNQEEVLE
jgi:hypothetical protein